MTRSCHYLTPIRPSALRRRRSWLRALAVAIGWLLMIGTSSAAWPAVCLADATVSQDASGEDPRQRLFGEAVAEYQAALDSEDRDERLSRFQRAELLFRQLAEGSSDEAAGETARPTNGSGARQPRASADLLVNLGNAALGGERLGAAILAYRQALRQAPGHRRAEQNLRSARALLPSWVPRPPESAGPGSVDNALRGLIRQPARRLFTLAAALFLLAAALLAAALRWPLTWLRGGAAAGLVLWLAALAAGGFAVWTEAESAVIIVPDAIARAADSPNAPNRFDQPLPAGTEVTILHRRAGWVHAELANGRDCWLPESAVATVRPSG